MKEEYGETFADDGFRFSNPRPSRSLWAIEHYWSCISFYTSRCHSAMY
jgi:hypothetical protein